MPMALASGAPIPSAQGQATTRTVKAWSKASSNGAAIIHPANVRAAIPITAGIKIPEILSTVRWMGDRVRCASSINRTIWAWTHSRCRAVTVTTIAPSMLIVAAKTRLPGCFAAGTDSPVRIASLMFVLPSSTTPSSGIRSPGRTLICSPTSTSLLRTINSVPLCTTRAVSGWRSISFLMALEVRTFAVASMYRPAVTRTSVVVAVSK